MATALAISGGKIIAVGSDKEILAKFKDTSEVLDIKGHTIWPGLTDSHLHLEHLSQSLENVNCETDTLADCLSRVSLRVCKISGSSWILGHGWNHNIWENASYGTAKDLDLVSDEHPVYLTAKSLHAAWANTAALNLAGIDNATLNPPGGTIQRDHKGNPTGILLESAMSLIENIIPEKSPNQLAADFKRLQSYLWQMGITCVHDFDGPLAYKALQILQNNHELTLRVIKNLPGKLLPYLVEVGLRGSFGDDKLRLGSLKFFADGALGPQSAAMLAPYEGTDSLGSLLLNASEIFDIGRNAIENGWGLAVHAIGDRANRLVLDAFSDLREFELENKFPHLPHRIEHVQLLDPEDQLRFQELDITASVQPIHCTSDIDLVDKYWGKRSPYAYPFKSLLDSKTKILFGSDAPVESPNPFFGLHAAVTRRRMRDDTDSDGWHSEQRINLDDALKAYTLNPATFAGLGNRLGKLAPEYYADLIVLPVDPFSIDSQELYSIQPELTMINGKIVFQK
ncbi:MAG: amidohydrolase [Anaerolineaceae bacterium]|nr:amidohydrolase [Anaerolineaceae bacterium]